VGSRERGYARKKASRFVEGGKYLSRYICRGLAGWKACFVRVGRFRVEWGGKSCVDVGVFVKRGGGNH